MLHSPGSAERGKVEGIRERNRLANLKRSRRKHFAILCGLRGFTGVVNSRQKAEELTEGVSGVKWKACDTRAEAERFINFHLRRRGAEGISVGDLAAAVAAPIELDFEEQESKAEQNDGPADKLGAEFWKEVEQRLEEQGTENIEVICKIVAERDLCEDRDADVILRLLRVAGLAEEEQ